MPCSLDSNAYDTIRPNVDWKADVVVRLVYSACKPQNMKEKLYQTGTNAQSVRFKSKSAEIVQMEPERLKKRICKTDGFLI